MEFREMVMKISLAVIFTVLATVLIVDRAREPERPEIATEYLCPEDYQDESQYISALAAETVRFIEQSPEATLGNLLEWRYHELESHQCVELIGDQTIGEYVNGILADMGASFSTVFELR